MGLFPARAPGDKSARGFAAPEADTPVPNSPSAPPSQDQDEKGSMPDHVGDRGAELLVLAPHDHLHINQNRAFATPRRGAKQFRLAGSSTCRNLSGRVRAPTPPFGADGESIPITALAMPIRVFCAPPAGHAAEITDPPGGPRCRCGLELAAPVWRSVSGMQVNRASWLLGWRLGRVGFS